MVVKEFQKQFYEVLLPRIPHQHLPILVHGAYNTMTQFHMTVWRMEVDECIMPMCHMYLSSFGIVAILQHALEKVPSTCMLGIPPCPTEPKDKLSALVDSLGSTPMPQTPAGRMPSVATSGAQGSSSTQSTGSMDTGCIQRPLLPSLGVNQVPRCRLANPWAFLSLVMDPSLHPLSFQHYLQARALHQHLQLLQ